jgi:hypothetical protein
VVWIVLAAMQVFTASQLWLSTEPGNYADYTFDAGASLIVGLMCALAIATLVVVWQGFTVELTPEGVVQRMPLFRRTIPWEALAPGGPAEPYPPAKRIFLAAARPDLVAQRGWSLFHGTRQSPILIVERHAWLVARAIRHYVDEPANRAAIGTSDEYARLAAALATPPPAPAAPTPGAPLPYATTMPARPRLIRAATILVYVGVAVAVLTAAADLLFTVVFRDNLLAAERVIAETNGPMPDDGSVFFSTDSMSFVRGESIWVLVLTAALGLVAILLSRAVVRGADGARIGLIVLSGVYGVLALCPCAVPLSSLAEEPAAGTFLNGWSAARTGLGTVGTVFGFAVLFLLLNTKAGPPGGDHADRPPAVPAQVP